MHLDQRTVSRALGTAGVVVLLLASVLLWFRPAPSPFPPSNQNPPALARKDVPEGAAHAGTSRRTGERSHGSGIPDAARSIVSLGDSRQQQENGPGGAPSQAASEQAPQAAARIGGHVTDSQGEPLGGIGVELRLRKPGGAGGSDPDVSTLTGGDGRFEIASVQPGDLNVTVVPPVGSNFVVPPTLPLRLEPGEARDDVDFQLKRGGNIDGLVMDEAGEPIAEGTVEAMFGAVTLRAATDGDGYYNLEGLPLDEPATLVASKDGFEPSTRQGVSPADGAQNFTLRRSIEVTLLVVDGTGAPVTDYKYSLWSGVTSNYFTADSAVHVTPTDGRTVLAAAQRGRWRVEVSSTDKAGVAVSGSARFAVPGADGGSVEVRVVVYPSAVLVGRVVNLNDDSPVAGMELGLRTRQPSPLQPPQALSGADGTFSFPPVPPGSYEVLTSGLGMYTEARLFVTVPTSSPPEPVVVGVRPGATIRGWTVDASGEPVPGVTIERTTRRSARFRPMGRDRQTTPADLRQTDAQGYFEYIGVMGGISTLAWTALDGTKGTQNVTVALGATVETEIIVMAGVVVEGTVTVAGQPWAGDPWLFFANAAGEREAGARARDGGTYRVVLKPGLHAVMARAGRRGPAWQVDSVEVPASVESVRHDIAIEPVSAEVVLDDQVPEFTGAAQLSLEQRLDSGATRSSLQLLRDRRQVVTSLSPGEWRALVAHRPAGSRDYQEIGASEWTIVAPGAENVLLVRSTDTEEHTFELTLTLPRGNFQYKFSAVGGGWWLDPLNPMTARDGGVTNSAFRVPGGAVDANGNRNDWPRVDDATGEVTFRTTHRGAATSVFVPGTFNAWQSNDASRMRLVEAP